MNPDNFEIKTGVMQGGIPSPVLFNFILRKVIDDVAVRGVKFAYE